MTDEEIHNIYLHMSGKAEGLVEATGNADFPVLFARAILEYEGLTKDVQNMASKFTHKEQLETKDEPVMIDYATMQLAESVGLIGPASRTHNLHDAIQRFHDLICANATIKAAVAFSRTLEAKDEPVAYINVEQRKLEWAKYMSWDTPTVVNLPRIPLYTQTKEWVGLNGADWNDFNPLKSNDPHRVAEWVEKLLKERNT